MLDPAASACSELVFYDAAAAAASPGQVSVVGPFNDWTAGVDVLVDPEGDGLFVGAVRLGPGLQTYLLEVDGALVLDAFNPLTLFDEAGERELSARYGADCARPRLHFLALEASAEGVLSAQLAVAAADGSSAAALVPEARLGDGTVLDATLVALEGAPDAWSLRVDASGLAPGKHRLSVSVTDAEGRSSDAAVAPFWVEATPFSWRDAVIYQVFVDRFRRGGGALADAPITWFHGGDLWGVLEAIEDGTFAALGVNTLWLSPLYQNPEGRWLGRLGIEAEAYHGYWPIEPRVVAPRFGGEAALEAVVAAAHARGMRVVVDAVLNHVHWDHPYHRRGPGWLNHPEADCICGSAQCPWLTHIAECWFDPFLPDLDWREREVLDTMTEDAVWWVERFDLDGLRLDAVPMMPRLAMRHLRARLEARLDPIHTHTYLLGETYTGLGEQAVIRYWLGDHTLSGQFDFPVMWALREALAGRSGLSILDREVRAGEAAYGPSGAVMAPLLGNHDVPRFVSDVNGDTVWSPGQVQPAAPASDSPYEALAMAWSFVLTQPGAPVIYNGDEYGEPGANDPDNRRNTRSGDALSARERAVLEHTRRVGRARACSEALRRGARTTLVASADLYVYARHGDDGLPALVALNTASVPQSVEVTLPSAWPLEARWSPRDVVGDVAVSVDGRTARFEVAARSSVVAVDAGCAVE